MNLNLGIALSSSILVGIGLSHYGMGIMFSYSMRL